MARLAPCETLGASAAVVAAAEASARSEGAEGEPVEGNLAVAAGPFVLGSAAWEEAGGDAAAPLRHLNPSRFLTAAVVGTKTSRKGSAALGEGHGSYTCGVPHTPMSEAAAKAARASVQLARNRVGPGAYSVEERSLPSFLTKEKERWELVVKDFLRKQAEYEKYKPK
jgi:hypothetical protein